MVDPHLDRRYRTLDKGLGSSACRQQDMNALTAVVGRGGDVAGQPGRGDIDCPHYFEGRSEPGIRELLMGCRSAALLLRDGCSGAVRASNRWEKLVAKVSASTKGSGVPVLPEPTGAGKLGSSTTRKTRRRTPVDKQYVGVDLHRRRSVIVRKDAAGELLETVQIDNDPIGLAEVMARAGEAPEVVLEATYGWYWAADVLAECGASVHLAHPLGNSWGNRRVKNDERDATDLIDMLRLGRLAEAYIAPPGLRELRRTGPHRLPSWWRSGPGSKPKSTPFWPRRA